MKGTHTADNTCFVITRLSPAGKQSLRRYAQTLDGYTSPLKAWAVRLLLAAFTFTDTMTALMYCNILFNDRPFVSFTTAAVVAALMDLSPFVLGTRLNTVFDTPREKVRNRWACLGLLIASVGAFLILGGFCILAQNHTTTYQGLSGTITVSTGSPAYYGKIFLAATTNLFSFVLGLQSNPYRAALTKKLIQRQEKQMLLDANQALLDKYNADMAVFSSDRYDLSEATAQLYSLEQLTNSTMFQARVLLAEELGSAEAAEALLTRILPGDYFEKAAAKLQFDFRPEHKPPVFWGPAAHNPTEPPAKTTEDTVSVIKKGESI